METGGELSRCLLFSFTWMWISSWWNFFLFAFSKFWMGVVIIHELSIHQYLSLTAQSHTEKFWSCILSCFLPLFWMELVMKFEWYSFFEKGNNKFERYFMKMFTSMNQVSKPSCKETIIPHTMCKYCSMKFLNFSLQVVHIRCSFKKMPTST